MKLGLNKVDLNQWLEMSDSTTKINAIVIKGDKEKFDEWMIRTKSILKLNDEIK